MTLDNTCQRYFTDDFGNQVVGSSFVDLDDYDYRGNWSSFINRSRRNWSIVRMLIVQEDFAYTHRTLECLRPCKPTGRVFDNVWRLPFYNFGDI